MNEPLTLELVEERISAGLLFGTTKIEPESEAWGFRREEPATINCNC